MYKEQLHNMIIEKFIADEISSDKFIRLSEKINSMSEVDAQVLTEGIGSSIGKGLSDVGWKAQKYTGIHKLKQLSGKTGDIAKAAQDYKYMKSLVKKGALKADNPLYKKARNQWLKLHGQRVGIVGAQAAGVGAAGYGVKKAVSKKKK